jgi:hypothetical protein
LLGFGERTLAQLNLFLLEIAFRKNRALGCSLLGIGIAGVTLPDAAIRIADNHVDVSGTGILCGADGAEITDNLVTEAMTAASPANTGKALGTGGVGIGVMSVPGGKLPVTAARILRNRINTYRGPGISVNGGVLTSSIVGNSIMFVTQTGIAFSGPQLPSEVMIRDNEVFNVVPPAAAAFLPSGTFGPQTTGASLGREMFVSGDVVRSEVPRVTGIQVTQTTTATIENNSVALIGVAGRSRAIGISAENSTEATIVGNDISDIGPITAGAAPAAVGAILGVVNVAKVSNNVIRQTSSGATAGVPFRGILLNSIADRKLIGEALVNGNMVYGNSDDLLVVRVAHCVLSGNLCKQAADIPGSNATAVMLANGLSCIASNNRILSAGKVIGLSITVPSDREHATATVVGNIAAIAILLNGHPLPAPWAPLNLID